MADPPTAHGHEKHRTWTRDGFLISTDPSLISVSALNAAFGQDWLYWAQPLPAETMTTMINNSLCFGLFTPTPATGPTSGPASASTSASSATPEMLMVQQQDLPDRAPTPSATTGTSMIGFARAITDRATFFYLTDVYVLPEWTGAGLGSWLVECVQQVVEGLPWLRRSMLITGATGGLGAEFYAKRMKMHRVEGEGKVVVMSWKGPANTF